jgi:SAM-dependent methyltransferase
MKNMIKQIILRLYKALPRPVRSFGALIVGRLLGRQLFWDIESLIKPKDSILSGCTDEEDFAAEGIKDTQFILGLQLATETSTTLHIGCGMGRVEKQLVEHVAAVHGIDVSRVMIQRAREYVKHPRAHFHVGNGENLSTFTDDMFDLIYSLLVFQHFPKTTALSYLQEVKRTLKPGGRFLCQYQYKGEEENIEDPDPSHPWGIRLYNEREIREMAGQAGLTIERFIDLEEAREKRRQGIPHAECNIYALYVKSDDLVKS